MGVNRTGLGAGTSIQLAEDLRTVEIPPLIGKKLITDTRKKIFQIIVQSSDFLDAANQLFKQKFNKS